MKQVSVILPTYNRCQIVGRAIRSVLDQTFTDLELIVVDDGSTDDTRRTVSSFVDPRLKYCWFPNGGAAVARNRGIEASSGKWIAFLDSDDVFLPCRLSSQMRSIEMNPGVGLTYGANLVSYESGPRSDSKNLRACSASVGLEDLLLGPQFHTSTILVQRLWLDKIQGFNESLKAGEEWELCLRLALAGCEMSGINEPIAVSTVRRVSETRKYGSMSGSVSPWLPQIEGTLKEVFADPRMPRQLEQLRGPALAALYVRHAGSAYLQENFEAGRKLLQLAFKQIGTEKSGHDSELLIESFVSYISGLCLEDPEVTLLRLTFDLPDTPWYAKLAGLINGEFHSQAAFAAYERGQRIQTINHIVRAMTARPSKMRDRGMVSIFVRSLIGARGIDLMRALSEKSV